MINYPTTPHESSVSLTPENRITDAVRRCQELMHERRRPGKQEQLKTAIGQLACLWSQYLRDRVEKETP